MSMFVSFTAVPKSMQLPATGMYNEYLYHEVDVHGTTDYKPEVKPLGLFKSQSGTWDSKDFLKLYHGQHVGCGLDDIIPEEEFYRVLTPEMIAELEVSIPIAQTYDRAKARSVTRERNVPDVIHQLMSMSAAEDTVGNFIARFVESAKQAIKDFSADYHVLVEVH